GCAHPAMEKKDEKTEEYCAGDVCLTTEEGERELEFRVDAKVEGDFILSVRLETRNPPPSTWPEPQRDFVLTGPLTKHRIAVLPLSKPLDEHSKYHYSFHFYWRRGSPGAKHDPQALYRLPFELGRGTRVGQGYEGNFSHMDE